jgi:hypothetical protein
VLLFVLYAAEVVGAALLYVPTLASDRRAARALNASLAFTSAVQSTLAWAAGDGTALGRSALLFCAFAKSAIVAASSRHHVVFSGIVDTTSRGADAFAAELRHRASRYRLASTSLFAIAVLVVYTAATSENIFARSPVARALAKAQLTRAGAGVALLASLGSEDVSMDRGRKKDL